MVYLKRDKKKDSPTVPLRWSLADCYNILLRMVENMRNKYLNIFRDRPVIQIKLVNVEK